MSSPARNENGRRRVPPLGGGTRRPLGAAGRTAGHDGAERAAHALTKFSAQIALKEGVQRADLACRVFPDGMTVRIAPRTAFEPDALVVCPPPTHLNTMEIRDPVIVVEVLSRR